MLNPDSGILATLSHPHPNNLSGFGFLSISKPPFEHFNETNNAFKPRFVPYDSGRMHPELIQIFHFKIYWFGFMMAAAFLLAVQLWNRLGRPQRYPEDIGLTVAFWIMISGITGARAAYVLADPGPYLANPLNMIKVWEGGIIYYGGFIGAALACMVLARRLQRSILEFGDLVIVGVPIGHALGRIGCFMNGCCFGRPSGDAPGVVFPYRSDAWYSQVHHGLIPQDVHECVAVHPVQLYESGLNIIVFVLLVYLFRKELAHGTVLAVYLLCYPVIRFFMEMLRGDNRNPFAVGLNMAQGISMALLLLGIVLFVFFRRPREHDPADSSA